MKRVFSSVFSLVFLFVNYTFVQASSDNFDEWYSNVISEVSPDSFGYGANAVQKEFFVSESGDDLNIGSREAPFKSVSKALEEVRKINKNMTGDIIIHILSGEYFFDEPLDFKPADSGTNGYSIIFLGDGEEQPVLTGGTKVSGFTESSLGNGIYEADFDEADRVCALFVNGVSKRLASTEWLIEPQVRPDIWNTDEWYANNSADVKEQYTFFDPKTKHKRDGIFVNKEDAVISENTSDAMIVWERSYISYSFPIDEVFENPENSDQYIIRMNETWNEVFAENDTDAIGLSTRANFRIENSAELLDSPGEFYYDRTKKKLFYIPEEGENMSTAEVVVPVKEDIINIAGFGTDDDQKVKNITFENIKFAHTKWTSRMKYGSVTTMGEQIENQNGLLNLMNTIPTAVRVSFADNVNFKFNTFFGTGGSAIHLLSGCKNINIFGNAFSDIGAQAVTVDGYNYHILDKDTDGDKVGLPNSYHMQAYPDAYADVLALGGVRVDASYNSMVDCDCQGYFGGQIKYDKTTGLRVLMNAMPMYDYSRGCSRKTLPLNYDRLIPNGAWKSNPKAEELKENQWIKYDFGRKYDIKEIILGFAEDYVSETEKDDFEILLSNDENFNEYVTVAKQETPVSGVISRYNVTQTEKYRYIMVRALNYSPFAVSAVWVMSGDFIPFGHRARNTYINVSNNYITRVGTASAASGAIGVSYSDYCTVAHNFIEDVPYSGIMMNGGGADVEKYVSRNNYIGYNYIKDTNKIHQDGSAIYIGGNKKGSIIEKNLIDDINLAQFGYYSDCGASDALWLNNIVEGSVYSYSFYLKGASNGTMRNIGRNMYSTNSFIRNSEQDTAADNNDIDKVKLYPAGQYQHNSDLYDIAKKAGLEDEYEYIKTLVPDNGSDGIDEYYWYENTEKFLPTTFLQRHWDADIETAQNMLSLGTFGEKFGEYPEKYRTQLKEFADLGMYNASPEATLEKLIELHNLINEVKESASRWLNASRDGYFSDGYTNNALSFIPYKGCDDAEIRLSVGLVNKTLDQGEAERYELRFTDGGTYLYVISGRSEILAGYSLKSLKYNKKNVISYSLNILKNTNNLQVYLNNEILFNKAVYQRFNGKYFGVVNKSTDIEILGSEV